MLGGAETFNSEDHADTSLSLGPGERFVRRAYLNLQMRPAPCSFSLAHSENGGRPSCWIDALLFWESRRSNERTCGIPLLFSISAPFLWLIKIEPIRFTNSNETAHPMTNEFPFRETLQRNNCLRFAIMCPGNV